MTAQPVINKARRWSNLIIAVAGVWAVNWGSAKLFGKPWIYCAIVDTRFLVEVQGLYHLGILGLGILTALSIAQRSRDAAGHLMLFVLFAGMPHFIETLFHIAPGCGASAQQSVSGMY